MLHPDAVIHGVDNDPGKPGGTADFRKFHDRFCSAIPDIRIVVEDVIVEGEKTAIRFRFMGTHLGEGLGVSPSRNPIESTGLTLVRWRDGKIAEGWNEIDRPRMVAQINRIT